MTDRLFSPAVLVLLIGVGLLRTAPVSPALQWLHSAAWAGLLALAALSLLTRGRPTKIGVWLPCIGLSVATALTVRFGRYECWTFFLTLCGSNQNYEGWNVVYVSQDSFSYIERFGSNSLRPPLYYWLTRLASLFAVAPEVLDREARSLIVFETDAPGLVSYLRNHPAPALLRVAHAQQVALWAATLFFVWSASRVVPIMAPALGILALYDGGVLTHASYTHAIEAKTLYLACFFAAAGASLSAMHRPRRQDVLLAAFFASCLPLARPQGLVAGLIVVVVCLRYLAAQPRLLLSSLGVATAAAGLFAAAAVLPSAVTFLGQRVLQPSNIYALSRIPFAIELATPADLGLVKEDFDKELLATMLAMRDDGERPPAIQVSLARNQGIAMSACDKVARARDVNKIKVICAGSMLAISNVVFREHYGEYLTKIAFPAIVPLNAQHVGGTSASIPVSLILGCVLAVLLLFLSPWLALWGTTFIALHVSLVVILALFVGPVGGYLFTGEPILLSVLVVMFTHAVWALRHRGLPFGWQAKRA